MKNCNPEQYTLSQLFEISGAYCQWTHQRECRREYGACGYYYDEYLLTLHRGKQRISLERFPINKKRFGPTPLDFLKELRRQLDRLYGNTDEYTIWEELYQQKHEVPGTRAEFERLVSIYVVCKRWLGYWFPLLRYAEDDIPLTPSIPGEDWMMVQASQRRAIDLFFTSDAFRQMILWFAEAYQRGTLPRLIAFHYGDEPEEELNKTPLSEMSKQVLEVFLPDINTMYQHAEQNGLTLQECLEEYVDQHRLHIAQIIQEWVGIHPVEGAKQNKNVDSVL